MRRKLWIEGEQESARHEVELLELWQAMSETEEEAAVLEAKENVALKIIDIHGRLLTIDAAMCEVRNALVPAVQAAEAIFLTEKHKNTTVQFVTSEEPPCGVQETINSIKVPTTLVYVILFAL
jgi:hypothetical protein